MELVKAMKILLVGEDKRLFKEVICCLTFITSEISIISVADGLAAIQMVQRASPDLVILDSVLPDMAISDLLKKIHDFSEDPLFVICRIDAGLQASEVLEAGADEYVTETLTSREFITKVRALLGRIERMGLHASYRIDTGLGMKQ